MTALNQDYPLTSDATYADPNGSTNDPGAVMADSDGDGVLDYRDHVNVPNLLGMEGTSLVYTEGDGAVVITASLTLSDADDTNLESAIIRISGNYVNGEDVLSFTNQNGIIGIWDSGSGTLALTGTALVSEYEAALRSITFTNSSDTPNTATRTISFSVNDGDFDSIETTRDVTVAATNNAPTFTTLPTAAADTIETLTGATAITSADLNNDTFVDLITTTDTGELRWHQNDGSGNFAAGVVIATADDFTAVEAIDLEGDGDIDIVAMNDDPTELGDSVYVLTNQLIDIGSTTFNQTTFEGAGGGDSDGGRDLALGDIDGDGRVDIVGMFYRAINDSQLVVFEQNSVGVFTKTYSDAVGNPGGVDLVDLDGDLVLDIVAGDFQDQEVRWYENDGNATAGFTRQTIASAGSVFDVVVGNFDGDADQDIAYINWGGNQVTWLENDGAASPGFTSHLIETVGAGLQYHIDTADTDGNGSLDLIVTDKIGDSIRLYENDGSGNFHRNTIDTSTNGPVWAEAADVDGDGELDIVFAANNADNIGVHENQGSGTYIRGSVNEDIALGSLQVQVADADAGSNLLEVSINVVNGRIILPTGSVTVLSGGSSTSSITFEGTVADINTALNSFTYAPDLNFHGIGEVQLTVDDRGNTGGGSQTASENLFIEVLSRNDAPVVSAPGTALSATEQTSLSIHGTGFSVTDVDSATSTLTATIAVGEGAVTVSEGNSGVTIVSGNGTNTVTVEGTVTQLNSLLTAAGTGTINYLNSSDNPSSSTTITVTVNDNGNTGADPGLSGDAISEEGSAVQTINIAATNDDPFNNGSLPSDVTVTEDVATAIDLSSFDLVDPDANGSDVILGIATTGGGNLFAASGGGVIVAGSGTSGLALTGSVADINTFLDNASNINYLHGTAHTHGDDADLIGLLVNDQGNTGTGGGTPVGVGSFNVDITAVNDVPIIDLDANDSSGATGRDFETGFTEDLGPVNVVDSDATLSDPDHANLSSIVATITNVQETGNKETLSADTSGTSLSAVWDNGTDALTISGTGTVADYEQVLRTVQYDNSANNPNTAIDRIITFTANDGVGDSLVATTTVSVTAVNDEPNTVAVSASGTEDDASIVIVLDGSDMDGNVQSFSLSNLPANGSLFTNPGLTNPVATATDYAATAEQLTLYFVPNSEWNGSTTFNYAAKDDLGLADSTPALATINVSSVNDSPVIGTNTGATLAEASTGNQITTAMLNEGDVDDDGAELTYTVTSVTSNGTLRLAGSALGLNDTFTQADIDAGDLTYDHDGTETTSDSFDFDLEDGGEDGASAASGTFNLTITPVNDQEILATNTGTTVSEGSSGNVVTTAMLQTTDNDHTAAQLTYTITGPTGNGTLFRNTTALGLNDTFTQADIDAGIIHYAHDGSDTLSDSVSFDVDDGVGSSTSSSFNWTITPVNDAPTVATNTGATFSEASTGNVIANGMLNEGDPDDSGTGLTYTITSVASNGTLRLSGSALGLNDTFTQADIDAGNVTYDHDGSETTSDSFGFSLEDGGEDGVSPATGTFNLTISAVNDEQVIATNTGTTVDEGSVATIVTTAMLETTDNDHIASQLTYTITDVADNGTLLRNTTALGLNDTFTQADIDAGIINYTHDGSDTLSDSFDFDVDDGVGATSSATFNWTINAINDAPTIATNTGATFNEASTGNTITSAMLSEGDPDDNGIGLTYTITSVTSNGTLRRGGFALGLNDTFTQADINLGSVTYDHDGSETTSDSFGFTLADGGEDGVGTASGTFNLTIVAVNDEQVIATNTGTTVNEGSATNIVTTTMLETTDNDHTPGQLTYTITDVTDNGTLFRNTTALGLNDTFTQADIDAGIINYTHDGSDTLSDSVSFDVDDGVGSNTSSSFNWTITPVNDAPTIAINTGATFNEATSGNVITNAMLNEGDPDDNGFGLTYTVTSVTSNGTLRRGGTALGLNDTFTQADINLGSLTYDHNGSETIADSFGFTLADGGEDGVSPESGTFNLVITPVNDEEVLVTNTGTTVNEGSSGNIVTTAMLQTTDNDHTAGQLTYTITDVTDNGTLFRNTTALGLNDTFTQADIDAGIINYTHDGSDTLSDSVSFDVDDGVGSNTSSSFNWTINPVNDAPVIATNTGATFNEASTGNVITTAMLNEGDPDDDGTELTYTITSPTGNGTLRLGGTALGLNDTFTQADIDSGDITYDHNGSETIADSFSFTLADGGEDGVSSDSGTFNLVITPVNDEEVLVTNTGTTVNEGSSGNIVTTAMLQTTDNDHTAGQLTYTITDVTDNGTLFRNTTALGLNDTFTQADIDAGIINYTHDGSDTLSDSVSFDVDDGVGSNTSSSFNWTINPVNDAPVIATNTGATFNEASTGNIITTAMLNEGDPDDDGTELTYTVTSVTSNGTLRVGGTALGLNDTFTQADIDAGDVTYDHDGSETIADSFNFTLADGGEDGVSPDSGTFNLTITPVNDEEVIATNIGASAFEGSSGNIVTTAMLQTTDNDHTAGQLTYTITDVTDHGTLFRNTTALGLNDTFTQADIDAGIINYTHDGSDTLADSFDFDVDDGVGTTSSGTFNYTIGAVNDNPVIATNTGATFDEHSSGNVITTAMLNEGDPDDNGVGLTYTITSVTTNGTLRLSGTAIGLFGTFTQADIDAGNVTYDHDGSETIADSFNFSLMDGGEDSSVPAVGTFALTITPVNDEEVLATNTGTAADEGSSSNIITAAMLQTTDNDHTAGQLTYTVDSVTANGTLFRNTSALGIGSTFTQADIDAGIINYTHDSSETLSDSFNFTVDDGVGTSTSATFNWTINPVNDAPVNQIPGLQTTSEDNAIIFSTGNGNAITVFESDSASSAIQVRLTASHGTFFAASSVGVTLVGDGTSVLTITGANADITNALNGLIYNPTPDYNGAATITVDTDDLGSNGIGGPLTDSDVININITPVNDAPVVDNSGSPTLTTITEDAINNDGDTIASIIATGAGGDPVTDLEGDPEGIAVHTVTTPGNGTWQYSQDNGATWTDLGTVDINNALLLTGTDRLRYVGDAENGTSAAVSWKAWDQTAGTAGSKVNVASNGGTTPFSVSDETATITVTDVNDGAEITGTNRITNGDFVTGDTTGWSTAGQADNDGSPSSLRFGEFDTPTNGVASQAFTTVVGETYELVFDFGDDSTSLDQDMQVTVNGTSLLSSNTFNSGVASNQMSRHSFLFVADSTTTTLTFTDVSANSVGVDGYIDNVNVSEIANRSYTENDTPLVLDPNLLLSDVDDATLIGATIQITGNFVASEDVLHFTDQLGITGGYDSLSGTLTLTGAASVADYQTALRSVAYSNLSENPSELERTVTWTSVDPASTGRPRISTIEVTAINDDPTTTGSFPTDVVVTEDILSNLDLSAVDLNDVDGPASYLTLTLGTSTGGELTASTVAGITVTGSGTNLITLSGIKADLNAYLDNPANVRYQHSVINTDGDDADTIQFTVTDNGNFGAGGGGNINLGTVNVDITSVNDAPVIATNQLTLNEGETVTLSSANFASNDPDNTNADLTYTISSLTGGQFERIGFAGTAITSFTQADVVAGNIIFVHDGNEAAPAYDVSVFDGALPDGPESATISFTNVNDDPFNAGVLPADLVLLEDVTTDIDLSAFTVGDVDAYGGNLTLTLSTTTGGTLNAASGGGVTVTGSGSTSLTLDGTLADLNAFIDDATNISYLGALHRNGDDADMINIVVNDNGNSGINGGGNVSLGGVNVDITAVNDDPANTGTLVGAITVVEDVASDVDFSALHFTDVDSATMPITVYLQAANGTLDATSGAGVTVSGDGTANLELSGTLSDINAFMDIASNVQFTSFPDAFGAFQDTIDVLFSDNGNVGLGGGSVFALGSVDVHITPVNDAPVAVPDLYSVLVNEVLVLRNPAAQVNDIDVDGDTLSVVIISGPSNGTLITNASGDKIYVPNANFFGTDTIEYQATDGALNSATEIITIEVLAGGASSGGGDTGEGIGRVTAEDVKAVAGEITKNDDEEEFGEFADLSDTLVNANTAVTQQIDFGESDANRDIQLIDPFALDVNDLEVLDWSRNMVKYADANADTELVQQMLVTDLRNTKLESDGDMDGNTFESIMVGTAGIGASLFSIGVAFWALRGGAFLTVVFSSFRPSYSIDPAVMLEAYRGDSPTRRDGVDNLFG